MTRDVNARGELEPTAPLTVAQYQALRYRARGMTIEEAAVAVGIRRPAFMSRVKGAYRRLGVEGLVDALRVLGWLRVPPHTASDVGLAHGLGRRTLPWWDVP